MGDERTDTEVQQIPIGTHIHILTIPSKFWRAPIPVIVLHYDQVVPLGPQPAHSRSSSPALSTASSESDEGCPALFDEVFLKTAQPFGPRSSSPALSTSEPMMSTSFSESDESYLDEFSSGLEAEVTYGQMYNPNSPNDQLPVVIKIYEMESVEPLTSELQAYRQLESLQGTELPKLWAIIAPFPREWIGIVLENVGPSLVLERWDGLKPDEKIRLHGSLRDIHRLGVEHGDIALRNIVRRPTGALTFIDFGHSKLHHCPGEDSCKELLCLRRYLGL
ncbi:hypothetical protein B0H13DRAFT_2000214 [Mycena leptocephala]|nr:hypothetical protein B0H13DRAFT_2000214 [Mycena leptocephala]